MITRRVSIICLILLVCTSCFGQKAILLTKQGGVYTIPCTINGIKRSLVFDTGASTVTISMQLAELLYSSGKLNETDIKGYGKSQTASGHIVDNMAVILRDIEIAGLHLKNVDAVVISGQNVPLLLGLSAIEKLGEVTLSGNKLLVNSKIKSNSDLNTFRAKIEQFIESDKYEDAIRLLKTIEAQDALDEIDLRNLTLCYCCLADNNKTLIYCQQWMGLYKDSDVLHEAEVCYYMALAYKGLKSHYDADKWFAHSIRLVGGTKSVNETNEDDAYTLSRYYNQKALNYLEGKAYDYCAEAFDIAVQYRIKYLGATIEDIFTGKLKDERIGIWLESISKIYAVFLNNEEASEHYAVMAALCGNQEAIDVCKHFGLNYSPIKK